jgi:hypothetical protein
MAVYAEIFRGSRSGQRIFAPDDIQTVQNLLAANPDWSRQQLSMHLCQLWDWKDLNGTFNRLSCQHWLKRLEKKGHLQLPKSLSRRSHARRTHPEVCDIELELFPASFSLNEVVVRPIAYGERLRWRGLMRAHHYLGFQSMVGESIGYVATVAHHWIALLGWAAAAFKSCHREAWIGWDEALKLKRLHLIANNVRFLILPGISVKHLASKVLALNLKRLSSDWQRRYSHPLLLVETFVDPARFAGTCYKAAGFFPLGQTKGFMKTRHGYVEHGQPRVLLIRPLHPKAREFLCAPFPSVPHPHNKEVVSMIDVNRLPLVGEGSLMELLEKITDPRKPRGVRHPMVFILALAVCAVLSGMKSVDGIAQWAACLPKEALEKLGATRRTPPSEPTFRRVLHAVDVAFFDAQVGAWLAQQHLFPGQHVAVDGKTIRGSHDGEKKPLHLLSAVLAPEGVTVAQRKVNEKTNEIPEIKPLLEPLDLKGSVVTADALHTQTETARYLVEEKQADYLFVVKGNQLQLKKDIADLPGESFSPSGDSERQGARADRNTHAEGEYPSQ